MSRFVLTAQLQLQAPRNVNQVVNQIQRQLNGVNVNLNVQGGRQATRQIAQVNQQVNNLNKGAKNLGKNFGVSVKRFAAFSIANRAVSLFANKLSAAVEESISFQRELIKIKQVSGATNQALSNLTGTITDLSTGLGTSSKDLLATSRILAQTGLQAAQLEVALSALAKTTLAPTFENIEKTAEGAVAILAQFGRGVGALESQLGSINAVAGQFAVESGDLISAVRRTGGVFKSAGGDLNELLGLFTSVRATTRESAESIATGLRTIFTRIQRPKTIEFLKQYGVELTNLEGKFVGPFEAVRQLSQSLQGLEEGDIRFVQIAEELGGFRQIGKVIPLIQQFEVAERARAAAVAGSTSLDKDAQTAQEALAVQIQKTRENFLALIRSLSETTSFQVLVKTTLGLADALIKVADALSPIVPLLGAFAGLKIAKGLGSFAGGLRGAITNRNAGGPIGFATGGVVPGTGNRDTVPAMLTPGEFVIRKSSVKKLGAGTLAAMNNNRYAVGGKVKIQDSIGYVTAKQGEVAQDNLNADKVVSLASLRKKGINPRGSSGLDGRTKVDLEIPYRKLAVSSSKDSDFAGATATKKALEGIDKYLNSGVRKSGFPARPKSNISGDSSAKASLNGYIFEQILTKFGGKAAEGGQTPFDFIGINNLANSLENDPVPKFLDAARTKKDKEDMRKKALNAIKQQGLSYTSSGFTKRRKAFFGGAIQKFALGGLATKNRVGFAILDPDQGGADLSASVTRAQIRGAVKGTDAQKKALDKELSWPSKNYKVSRQGLPKKTSDKFYDTIIKEAVTGVDAAASSLSQTLGQGAISMPQSAKDTMTGVIRKSGSQMGRLFEDVLDVIDNRGDFKPAPKGAPWDFRAGLTGGLASTYNKMPSSFVDARTSYGRSTAAAAQGKIIDEIAQEYQRSSTFKTAKANKKQLSASEQSAQEKRRAKQAARMAKMREKAGFAKGGAASDTVPALLTPGEFVINAKAASRIGKANLDRMNKKGVAGFAAGGPVGKVQRFNRGGPSQEAGSARGGVDAAALAYLLPTVIDSMIPTVEKTDQAISELGTRSFDTRNAFSSLITTLGITGVAMSTFGLRLKDLGKFLPGARKKANQRFAQLNRGFQSGNLSNADFDEFMDARETRRNRRSAPARASRSVRGRLAGGRLDRLTGGRLAGGAGRVAGGAVRAFGAVARFAGPVGIAAGGLLAFNSVLKAGFGFQEKFNNAVKLGNVERAKELAVLKEVPAIIALGGKNFSEGFIKFASFFGGNTLESVKANAEAQALAGKSAKEFEKNAKAADEALRELKAGTKSAADAFASGELTANLRNTLEQGAAELKAAQAEYENELNRFAPTIRDFIARNLGLGSTTAEIAESAAARREEKRQKAFDATSKRIDELGEATRISNRQIILSGGNFQQSLDRLQSGLDGVSLEATLTEAKAKSLGDAFQNQAKEIISNLKAAKALNSSLFTLDSTLKGLNAGLADSVAKASGQFNQLSSTLNQLEAATKGAAFESRGFRNNILNLGKELSGIGVDRRVVRDVQDQFLDLNRVTGGFADALNKIRSEIPQDIGDPQKLFDALEKELTENVVKSNAFKDLFKDQKIFEGLGLDQVGKDISEITKELVQRLAKGAIVDLEILRQYETALGAQAKILKEVAKTEKELLDIRLAGVDSEIKGAELLEEFGVKTFTVAKRLELLNRKLEEGVGEKVAANAESLSVALADASAKLEAQTEALFNAKDAQARQEIINEIDKERANIDRLNSSINARIAIEKEALKVARDKLKLDQQAIDSLLSGNIEDFLRQQEAAAARRALISGNAAAAGNFSPRALGEALKTITDVDQRRTAAQTGVAGRFLSQSMANILTENTSEIRNSRKVAEELVAVQNQAASATEKAAEALKDNADKQLKSSKEQVDATRKNLESSSEKQAAVNQKLSEQITEQESALKENTKAIQEFTSVVRKQREEERVADEIERKKAGITPTTFDPSSRLPLGMRTGSANIQQSSVIADVVGAQVSPEAEKKVRQSIDEIKRNQIRDRFKPYGAGLPRTFFDPSSFKSRGGHIPLYAAGGMFVPRGTDTVPAMLTPGEFVVNRKAVNTGNNRQVLEAMNGGASGQNGVYYNNGGEVGPSVDTKALKAIATSLSSSFSKFNDTVDRLINFKFEMTIAPTRVDVVINTPQAMEQMSSQAKEQLLTAVVDEISINQLGKLRRNRNA